MNFVRYLPVVIYDISTGGFAAEDLIIELIQNDIFHFAGSAMILFGIFLKLKLSDAHILIIAVAMSLINTAIPMGVSGSLLLNGTAGHFIFIGYPGHTIMCFPLLAWFIFPAFGYWLMNGLKEQGRTERVFKLALIPCFILSMGAAVFESMNDVYMMRFDTDCDYFRMITLDAAISLCYAMFCFAFFFFVSRIAGERLRRGIAEVSNALNMFYMIHWVLEFSIANVIISKIMKVPYSHQLVIAVSIVIAVVSGFLGISAKNAVKARLAARPGSILRFVK